MVRTLYGNDYAIVYNGEVYNTDELYGPLKNAGFEFETTCDTEVVLYAYIHYGVDFVKKLNGIFAFAIWDGGLNTLLLYRDRLGVKPLFYSIGNNTLVFGSEPKVLFAHQGFEPCVDLNGFREVFGLGPARTPGCGVFKGVCEIKPGHYGLFSRDGFHTARYWTLESIRHEESYEETVDKVSWLVRDAIKKQMVSDVGVCTFLSGGVDSSIVTAVASLYLDEKDNVLNTFSFDFKGNEKHFKASAYQPERDAPYAHPAVPQTLCFSFP